MLGALPLRAEPAKGASGKRVGRGRTVDARGGIVLQAQVNVLVDSKACSEREA
jgi:hypothetical protein